MYEIEFTASAERQLFKLEHHIQERIIASLERIRIKPYPHLKKLVGCPYFRLRVGDYRIIIDVKENKMMILVLEIGHRKNIYK
ncbi:MAG: type II toxin-antitoxin system RelE/ParE family toxin [Nanoarchaeota archaeon]|nr:type II toxin-antitoxin system RelE/ParE family toxin [Nanoarchaeota archaeon]MBU1321830.1 type II toxin-antitoxin system RelE/ParE family toxin [Nanoarchaeota archaeon]MBU1597175.1 type II toxin-antitoxin system RelE/ParE family toxin [Nanoarchaeota archaeon]MBU2441652.1 type II toxin-antitoxin system RelE/ParE family toxin [Nanoarchaeota archaeon]